MMTIEQRKSELNTSANSPLADNKPAATSSDASHIAVWDIWTRLFHWSLAGSVIFLLVSGETGFQFYDWHRLVGEFVLMLLVFRILWGVLGSSNIRFGALFQHPANAITHLRHLFKRKVDDERGHNAAGSWAVLIMLLLLSVQAVSGMFIADEDELVEGAFYGRMGGDLSDLLYRVHHQNAELLIVLTVVHIAMILVYLVFAGKNLISPMFSGQMRWSSDAKAPSVKFRHWAWGAICLTLSIAATGWLVGWTL